jgi:hypothetical protein
MGLPVGVKTVQLNALLSHLNSFLGGEINLRDYTSRYMRQLHLTACEYYCHTKAAIAEPVTKLWDRLE